jgi:hypothetical protein
MGRVIEVVSGNAVRRVSSRSGCSDPLGMDQHRLSGAPSDSTAFHQLWHSRPVPLPIDPGEASILPTRSPFPMGGCGLVLEPARLRPLPDDDRQLRRVRGKRVMSEATVAARHQQPACRLGANDQGHFASGAGFGAGGRVGWGDGAGTYGWGGAAGTVALVHQCTAPRGALRPVHAVRRLPVSQRFPEAVHRRPEGAGPGEERAWSAHRLHRRGARTAPITSAPTPSASPALMDWRARLLKLDGRAPVLDREGTLEWGTLADAASDSRAGLPRVLRQRKACFAAVP